MITRKQCQCMFFLVHCYSILFDFLGFPSKVQHGAPPSDLPWKNEGPGSAGRVDLQVDHHIANGRTMRYHWHGG